MDERDRRPLDAHTLPRVPSSDIDWSKVLAFLPLLEAEDFSPGEWVPMETDERGMSYFPYVRWSPVVLELLETLGREQVIFPFDYVSWWNEGGRRYGDAPATIDTASLDDVRRLLTTHVRADRFVEGHLLAEFESGQIVRVLRRAAQLVSQTPG